VRKARHGNGQLTQPSKNAKGKIVKLTAKLHTIGSLGTVGQILAKKYEKAAYDGWSDASADWKTQNTQRQTNGARWWNSLSDAKREQYLKDWNKLEKTPKETYNEQKRLIGLQEADQLANSTPEEFAKSHYELDAQGNIKGEYDVNQFKERVVGSEFAQGIFKLAKGSFPTNGAVTVALSITSILNSNITSEGIVDFNDVLTMITKTMSEPNTNLVLAANAVAHAFWNITHPNAQLTLRSAGPKNKRQTERRTLPKEKANIERIATEIYNDYLEDLFSDKTSVDSAILVPLLARSRERAQERWDAMSSNEKLQYGTQSKSQQGLKKGRIDPKEQAIIEQMASQLFREYSEDYFSAMVEPGILVPIMESSKERAQKHWDAMSAEDKLQFGIPMKMRKSKKEPKIYTIKIRYSNK